MSHRILLIAALFGTVTLSLGHAADLTDGMKKGTPELKSAGPATFAPQGILLLGDTQGATIFAIATGDTASGSPAQPLNIERIDEQIAALLGTSPKDITINDLAVNPETGNAFLTVSRGTGPEAKPVIIRVDASGKLGEFSLADRMFSQASIPNAPAGQGTPGSDDRFAVHRRPGDRGRLVERRVRLAVARVGVPLCQGRPGHKCRDLSRRPRQVRNPLAGADLCGLRHRRRAERAGSLHLHAAWSSFPSPT